MKHQYFGDVNDYVKYGLLRVLGEVSGLRVGVAWMLTPDDDRPDGSRTAYWNDAAWRVHDPELFDRLARLSTSSAARNVELFQRWKLVPDALDFDAELPVAADERTQWLAAVCEKLSGCPLICFDPDNGFEVESVPFGRRGSNMYLYWHEAETAWDLGHSLLVYQHFPRENRDAFEAALREQVVSHLAGAHVSSFRSAHALFLLAARPGHAEALARATAEAARRWTGRVEVVLHEAPGEASEPEPSGPADRAGDLEAVCRALVKGGTAAAAAAATRRYPFTAPAAGSRSNTELDALRVWVRDGFRDRYDGGRLVFPGTLRLLSVMLPVEFPYHPNWKLSETHPAYWELFPTLDHVVPVARGGADEPANWVTTSQKNNSAKAHWTLEELGWTLHEGGSLEQWDGLTGWFRNAMEARAELRKHDALRHWAGLLARALPRD